MGVDSVRVRTVGELQDALARSMSEAGPFLIDAVLGLNVAPGVAAATVRSRRSTGRHPVRARHVRTGVGASCES